MNCDLYFTDLSQNQEVLIRLKPYQKINHFPGIFLIARKNFMSFHLRKMTKKFPEYFNFFPETFCLSSDRSRLIKEFGNRRRKNFIVKPDAGAQGRGIFLIRKLEDINVDSCFIVQKYISNPLLIDGLKFDLRFYVLITSIEPLTIYLYRNGLTRLATVPYEKPDDKNIKNVFMHLTNYSINKNAWNFVKNLKNDLTKGHKRSFASVYQRLRELN